MVQRYLNSTPLSKSEFLVPLGSANYLYVNIQKNKRKTLLLQNPLPSSFQLLKTPNLGCLKGKDNVDRSIAKK